VVALLTALVVSLIFARRTPTPAAQVAAGGPAGPATPAAPPPPAPEEPEDDLSDIDIDLH